MDDSNSAAETEFENWITKFDDPAVLAALPQGCHVLSTARHGKSFWATWTGRITVQLAESSPRSYFIKFLPSTPFTPDFAPQPTAWGTCQTRPDTHFFLCEFRNFPTDEMPDPKDFTARLADLHGKSQSPEGKFGFHSSWEVFFAKCLSYALDLEIKGRRGSHPELDALRTVLFGKVIPRLLRPLETGGRSVKPSLVHGDLWYANSGRDRDSGRSIIFDTCCFYAHNEYEVGQWKPACNKFDETHVATYHERVAKSEPVEDYDGRIDLYKLKFNTHVSALFPENQHLREQILGDMRDLVHRYGDTGTVSG
ncbi:Fructosamine kinase-domain-containing protein [Staphylotrichum tortipilum]|uniref:protein-ribulosamine 3-kinase n=1 Tax=Staphylotrichum tortipilum TaxID=2831512 RepID=A0AAN6RVU3_9PEZI|nr:Fructosamine kinase-domain-containing protein [Staphylotrichum longicolle]